MGRLIFEDMPLYCPGRTSTLLSLKMHQNNCIIKLQKDKKKKNLKENVIFIFIFLQFTSHVDKRKAIFSIFLIIVEEITPRFKVLEIEDIFFCKKQTSMCSLDFELSP